LLLLFTVLTRSSASTEGLCDALNQFEIISTAAQLYEKNHICHIVRLLFSFWCFLIDMAAHFIALTCQMCYSYLVCSKPKLHSCKI